MIAQGRKGDGIGRRDDQAVVSAAGIKLIKWKGNLLHQ